MTSKIFTIIAIAALLSGLAVAIVGDGSDASGSFTIEDGTTDSTGALTPRTFEYAGPSEHVVTTGYASTLTVVELGYADKIVATDTYGAYSYNKDERLKDLDVPSLGSIGSASNNDYIVATLVQWVEEGKISLDDTIIFTTYSNGKVIRTALEEKGFTHVLVYLSITDYDQIVKFVDTLSFALSGGSSKVVDDMKLVRSSISDSVSSVDKKSKAVFVWWSATGGFKVGNTGSLAVSLINAAGGDNIAYDKSVSAATYGDTSTIIQLVEKNQDVTLLLSDSYLNAGHTVSDFRSEVFGGKSVKIVPLEPTWNNYCPDASDGLWAVASALYPDLFEGDAPVTEETSDQSNVLLYVAAGLLIVIVVAAIAYFVLRKP
ncbi:MAG: hypothetical protein LBV63_04865 [Candidatus Methanoplasma sp.]|jgi:ABC-type Fe3+-hydroxamate transport system substrate-binding protein|nr:hypothetical protein [Candidatus Methanoplasma sp.]